MTEVTSAGPVNLPAPDLNGAVVADSIDLQTKYQQERDKRFRDDGIDQYLDPATSDQHRHFLEDPWVQAGELVNQVVPDGGHAKVLIAGAGFGGIIFAVRLLLAGFSVDDLLIVDPAGGFGGTWYWNRYPGLMCDVESYIYLPFLEETGYMPKHKYASGEEIRHYCDLICKKYDLYRRAMFQSSIKTVTWQAGTENWQATISQNPKGGESRDITIHADFVIFATGVLVSAKLPDLPGLDSFKGQTFHTARWNYGVSGGSQEHPSLEKLRSKRVAIIGTGATAVQAVPHLTRWAKELLVFQRTPSAVDSRDQRETSTEDWKTIANGPGWYERRNENFNAHVNNLQPAPKVNLVNDKWTSAPSYSALIGGKYDVSKENVDDHVDYLRSLDYPRQERVRQRAVHIVKDQETAKKLQAWYPTWCKRPCFHDEYLQSYNSPNVTLVDTDGKGIERITPQGIVASGREYEVDVLVWATGYDANIFESPPAKAGIEVTGVDGMRYNDLYKGDWATLHGVVNRQFPNLFVPGTSQTAATANYSYMLNTGARHVAYIMAEASQRAAAADPAHPKPVIRPTPTAQDAWVARIEAGAYAAAGLTGCTPSYLTGEGNVERLTPEEQSAAARKGLLGGGYQHFVDLLQHWRDEGAMHGLEYLPERSAAAAS